ncbi:MAG TPA: O-antigen ligase family protein [Candidatus Binataceae bacterium]
MRRLDRIVTGGIILLVILTPLAIGSVLPWAYVPMEAAIFVLVIAWMAKLLTREPGSIGDPAVSADLRWVAIPLLALLGYLALQLLPLPPSLIASISPATWRLYSTSLPGWPASAPYAELPSVSVPSGPSYGAAGSQQPVLLPTIDEVRHRASIPFEPHAALAAVGTRAARRSQAALGAEFWTARWRPLAVAAALSWSGLLGCAALAAMFLLVAFYPLGEDRDPRADYPFVRALVLTIIAVAAVLAVIGFFERVFWNGKVLWLYVPIDWGQPEMAAGDRARGPFVDPDHFAVYLGMVFPLALSGALFPSLVTPRRWAREFQIFCSTAAFAIFVVALLTGSRAGWLGLILSACLLPAIVLSRTDEQWMLGIRASRARVLGYTLAGVSALLVFALLFVGAGARTEAQARINYALAGGVEFDRLYAWKGALRMIRDFPVFGVGLADWAEVFTRYQGRPWSELYFNEVHNDYLQFLAEAGVVGFALMAWLFYRIGAPMLRRARSISPGRYPLFAALVAGLAVTIVAEFFDFDLQIPAIAFLFVLMLGLAFRLARPRDGAQEEPGVEQADQGAGKVFPICGAVAALLLLIAVVAQDRSPYPYNLKPPANGAVARAMLLSYPADAYAHTVTLWMLGDGLTLAQQLRELQVAVALDPGNPRTRDLYVQALERAGKYPDAMAQLRESVAGAPAAQYHAYLLPQLTPWLSPAEQGAVEAGLRDSVRAGFPGALGALGQFYDALGRFDAEARLYDDAARDSDDPADQTKYLILGAQAWARAGDNAASEAISRKAIASAPDDPAPYLGLIELLVSQPKRVDAAKALVDEGVNNGADPYQLYTCLGYYARLHQLLEVAEGAYQKAFEYRPSSFDSAIALGEVYYFQKRFDRAALTVQRAVELDPNSAQAYHLLALTEQGSFEYTSADQAYRQAVALAPDDPTIRADYFQFQHKLTAGAAELKKSPELNSSSELKNPPELKNPQ